MKFKSVLASVAACAITVSAMAVPAFAEKTITNANAEANYKVDFADDANKLKAYGLKATITMADGWESSGAGGGIIANADTIGWGQYEWGITGEGTDAKNTDGVTISGSNGKFTITMNAGKAIFVEADTYTEGFVSTWWGSDFSVDSIVLVDENGNEFGAAAESSKAEESKAEESKAEESKAEESKAEESKKDDGNADGGKKNTQTTGTNTGDAGVGMAVAGLALAGAAAIAARKKH